MTPFPPFTFRPLTEADLPLLQEWLNRPHLQEWWREGEVTLDGLREKYLPRIAGADAARPSVALEPAAREVRVDPRPDNRRAIRCYEKVGFRAVEPITTPDGQALMMVLPRPEPTAPPVAT